MEHTEIIRLYTKEDLNVDRIGKKLSRSSKTLYEHVTQHNTAVERSGFCPSCRRVKSKYESKIAIKG